jgi:hypothetical protein
MTFSPAKHPQSYVSDGFGRDTYIFNNSGGFTPSKQITLVHELGSFVVQKGSPVRSLARIHSKPVIYTTNGGGRDTYIAQNDGGFRPMHRAGDSANTYFTSLRQYPEQTNLSRNRHNQPRHTLDVFQSSQDHYNQRFVRENALIRNYQHMMDRRLSVPK